MLRDKIVLKRSVVDSVISLNRPSTITYVPAGPFYGFNRPSAKVSEGG
jgi:hypothetical protein